MKVYKKSNIINYWDNILSEEDWNKLYNEVRKEILNDLLKEKYVEIIMKDGNTELDNTIRKVLSDNMSE